MRSRTVSDHRGRIESAGRSKSEMPSSNVLLVGFDHARNCSKAWRLIQSRYAPDIQNRQYAFMQKIMMLAKLWCDHAEGFASGLKAWELDVGEWEHASGTVLADVVKYAVMMNMAPIFLRNNLQLGTYANSAALRTPLLQWCYSSRIFGANPNVSAVNGTGADDDNRMQVDSLKKGKENGKGEHPKRKGSHERQRP